MFESEEVSLQALKATEPNSRREAALYLAEHPTPAACEALLAALGDPDPRAGEAVLTAVVAQTAADRVARLVTVLREDSPARRNAALSTLIEIGARDPGALTAALRHPSTEVRLHVAEVLGDLHHPATCEALIERLNDPNEFPNVRHAAAQALGKVGDRAATPALIAAAEQGDFWVRYAAIEALGRLGDEQAVGTLLRILKQDAWMRPATVQALGDIGRPEAVPDLAAALDDSNDTVRSASVEALLKIVVEPVSGSGRPSQEPEAIRSLIPVEPLRRELNAHLAPSSANAAYLLGWLGAPEALPDLIQTLGQEDESLRLAAVEAVLRYGAGAVPALLEALTSRQTMVRENAVELLGMLSNADVVPTLLVHLADASVAVRQAVLRALGMLGGEVAYQGLLQAMNEAATRDIALGIIGQLHDPALVDSLRRSLYEGEAATRWAAAQALSLLGDETAVSILLNAMRLPDERIRQPAAEALGRVRSSRAINVLIEAVGDRDWLVRLKAVEALGTLTDGRAVAALLALVHEPEWRVRKALVHALLQVGDSRVYGALEELAGDPNRWIRRAVMELSTGLDDPRASALLGRGLQDTEPSVRRAALVTAGRRHETSLVEAVVKALADAQPTVRLAAVQALSLVDEAGTGVESLAQLVTDPAEAVRVEVADALGQLGIDDGVAALENLLGDEAEPVRARAAEALGLIGTPRSLNTLVMGLLLPAGKVAAQAELVRQGAPALRALLSSARASDPALRAASAETLGHLRNSQAVPTLRLLTRDVDARVRQAASQALEALSVPD